LRLLARQRIRRAHDRHTRSKPDDRRFSLLEGRFRGRLVGENFVSGGQFVLTFGLQGLVQPALGLDVSGPGSGAKCLRGCSVDTSSDLTALRTSRGGGQ
jgi:hypothetical protein